MSGILFLLEVVAFVVVVRWALARCGPGPASAETGWLGMRSDDGRDTQAPPATWRASAPQEGQPRLSRSEPRWKRSSSHSPPPI